MENYTTENITEAGTLILKGLRPVKIEHKRGQEIYTFTDRNKCKEILKRFYFGGK